MAKITRATQQIFGSTAGLTQIGVFGSFAAGSPAYTTNAETIQSLTNYLQGWYAAVVGENSPAIQDMNALCYLFAYQLAYLMQEGIAEWDDATTYYVGSQAQDGNGNIYISLQNANLNNALSDISFWVPQNHFLNMQTYTSSATLASTPQYARVNATSAATITLPLLASVQQGCIITIKNVSYTSGAAVSIGVSGSDTIDGNGGLPTMLNAPDSMTCISTGTTWDVI